MIFRVLRYEWTKWRARGDCFYLALAVLIAAPLYGLALQAIMKTKSGQAKDCSLLFLSPC